MFFKLFKNYNNVFFHLIPFQILIVENISPNLLKINIKVDDAECFVCFENDLYLRLQLAKILAS